jgi:hypothetical protein
VRTEIRHLIEDAKRSGDRIGVDGTPDASALGAGIVRLARLATSIHLAESAHRMAASVPGRDRLMTKRESV